MAYSNPYAPSAPELPESYGQQYQEGNGYRYGYSTIGAGQPGNLYGSSAMFPPGTQPEVIRSFELADRDQSGFLGETKLGEALSYSGYTRLSVKTIRLLMFIFKNPGDSLIRLGRKEYVELWNCLGQWRAIFDRFDRDRSGKIDSTELRDALYHLGYMLPPSVLQLLIAQYDDGSGKRIELCFDSLIECGTIVKGLTDKFKEKDRGLTGAATLTYGDFMSMVIPFIVSYDD